MSTPSRFAIAGTAYSHLMRHPHRGFKARGDLLANAENTPTRTLLLRRPLWVLFVVGCFIALTAAGRLVPAHIVLAMAAWSFTVVFQSGALALTLRWAKRDQALAPAIDTFFLGHGPWFLFMITLVVVCFVATDVYLAFVWLLQLWILPVYFLGTVAWGMVTTYAFFRSGLSLSRKRSFGATASYYVLQLLFIATWYVVTGQLLLGG